MITIFELRNKNHLFFKIYISTVCVHSTNHLNILIIVFTSRIWLKYTSKIVRLDWGNNRTCEDPCRLEGKRSLGQLGNDSNQGGVFVLESHVISLDVVHRLEFFFLLADSSL